MWQNGARRSKRPSGFVEWEGGPTDDGKADGRSREDADNASANRPSRRSFLIAGAALAAAIERDPRAARAQGVPAAGTPMPAADEDLVLYNGKITSPAATST